MPRPLRHHTTMARRHPMCHNRHSIPDPRSPNHRNKRIFDMCVANDGGPAHLVKSSPVVHPILTSFMLSRTISDLRPTCEATTPNHQPTLSHQIQRYEAQP